MTQRTYLVEWRYWPNTVNGVSHKSNYVTAPDPDEAIGKLRTEANALYCFEQMRVERCLEVTANA